MPFIGLAEGYALAAFRQAGVPLQRIRPAIDALQRELGLEHALASRRLFTDGAEVLYDYAEVTIDARHAFGRPRFARGGAKIEDAIDLFRAGEPVDAVAEEYGLTRDEIEDALRVATRTAA